MAALVLGWFALRPHSHRGFRGSMKTRKGAYANLLTLKGRFKIESHSLISHHCRQDSPKQLISALVLMPAPHDYEIMLGVDPDRI